METESLLFRLMKPHLFIEMRFNNKGRILSESILHYDNIQYLCEAYGVYNGCMNDAKRIEEMLLNNRGETRITVEINNFFVKKVTLLVIEYSSRASYIPGYSIENDEKSFEEIFINVNRNLIGDRILLSTIMHELTHAYQDYNLRKKGLNLYDEMNKDGYQIYTSSKWEDPLLKKAYYVLYLLNYFEHGGFMSELTGEMERCNKKFKGIEQAIDYLRKTKTCVNYIDLEQIIDNFISINDTIEQHNILLVFNNLSKLRFNNYGKLRDWLRKRKYRSANKLATIIPKVAMKYLQVGEDFETDRNYKHQKIEDDVVNAPITKEAFERAFIEIHKWRRELLK